MRKQGRHKKKCPCYKCAGRQGWSAIVKIPPEEFEVAKRIGAVDVLASAPAAYGVTPENFRPQLTSVKEMETKIRGKR